MSNRETRSAAPAVSARASQQLCVRVDRAMELLDIGKTKLYELIASGELEAIRIGRRTLVLRESIEGLVVRLRRASTPPR
ncbi:helix-turn-helix domain-containing protein [Novosphingobium sp. Gsoil 351]|uniref:helix-turn-helix domain-containing protein n=1 Tax=Novosphingobium sp. Gsoil 351 TaxID=2675225 RepID=UPI0012B469E0|nr:helix-turn-helix domain-containing protein [Novosphingobium sp. Gsoil 351]QGN54110.1 helix-turn-helix domain-containing protein [Novosphingobium sp. Gsoil 351]